MLSHVGGSVADGTSATEGRGVPARKFFEHIGESIPSPLIRTSRQNGYMAGRELRGFRVGQPKLRRR